MGSGRFRRDSYGLSLQAAQSECKTVLMCGVRFMAETVKILSPDKKVILSNALADCPMARQFDVEMVKQLKESNPGYAVAAYINTTSELKTVCDVCVTSSSAVKIINNMEQKDILFIPDCNLGSWVAEQVPEKNIKLVKGGCPTHARMTVKDVEAGEKASPGCIVSCTSGMCVSGYEAGGLCGSTTGIMDYAKKSNKKEFIIGTENSIVQHLQFECPDKKFYPLSMDFICQNMKATTLADVYDCVRGVGGEEIVLEEEVMEKAKKCLDTMLTLG